MKISISSRGPNLDSPLEERFGRAPSFIIYDLNNDSYHAVDNSQNYNSPQGSGIQTAESIVNTGALAVVTGNVGPKAFRALQAAGVDIYLAQGTTVEEAIDSFKNGKLTKTETNNVEGHWSK